MTGSQVNTDGRSENLNREPDDDAESYDPNRHDNQIVALYETDARAHASRDALLAAGVPASAVQVVARSDYAAADTTTPGQGLWGAIKSLFVPDEDVTAYGHAVQHHGHAMLVVTPGITMDRRRVIEALEGTDPIDFDAKLEEWRQSGADGSAAGGMAVGAAAGMASPVQTESITAQRSAENDAMDPPDSPQPATITVREFGAGTASRDTVKVVEERLRVGTREAPQGAVRVRSYVVERSGTAPARLHEDQGGTNTPHT